MCLKLSSFNSQRIVCRKHACNLVGTNWRGVSGLWRGLIRTRFWWFFLSPEQKVVYNQREPEWNMGTRGRRQQLRHSNKEREPSKPVRRCIFPLHSCERLQATMLCSSCTCTGWNIQRVRLQAWCGLYLCNKWEYGTSARRHCANQYRALCSLRLRWWSSPSAGMACCLGLCRRSRVYWRHMTLPWQLRV